METSDQEFSPQQSLQLIESMINKTKADLSSNRFHFLLWGWATFFGCLAQYLLKVVFEYKHHYLVWLIALVAIFMSRLYVRRQRKKYVHSTYIGDSMRFLWMGVGISFFVLTIIISLGIGWLYAWPFMIMMYGLGTFVSGKILQFLPLVAGGVINWVLACLCTLVPYDYQILFGAAAILTSYIIPGYLLKKNPADERLQ